MHLLTEETTQEEVLALHHEVYQLKRSPREVPCSKDIAEEIHLEILETLKEHLWHRWGPTPPERESRQSTSRMPAQAELHTQVQVTYNHFGCHCRRQQESQEEALWLAKDVCHQALVAVAMLEGHIEQMHHSISWGQHRNWGQSGSHQRSGSRKLSRSHSHSRSCRRHPPTSPQGQTPPAEGCPGDAPRRWEDSPSTM